MTLHSRRIHNTAQRNSFAQRARIPSNFKKQLKNDPAKLMASIIRNQRTLYSKEVKHWKAARSQAIDVFNPKREMLIDLYKDIELDMFISGLMAKRILRISNKRFKVVDAEGNEKEELSRMMDKAWFRQFRKLAMQSHFYGFTCIYLWEWSNESNEFKKVRSVPREHVVPENRTILKNISDTDGILIDKPPFSNYTTLVWPDEDSLGLFDKAAPGFILKKHSWANWDEFEEIFGIPIRIAKTYSNDKQVQDEIEKWLQEMGTASYALFPGDADLDIKENKSTDAFNVFNEKRKAVNEELETLIMGVKNVSQQGGTYGKQQALLTEEDEVTEDDKAFIRDLVNDELIPMLRANGYPFADGDTLEWLDRKKTAREKAFIFKVVKSLGFKLDAKEVSEELDVTIVEDVQNSDPTPDPNNPDPGNDPNPDNGSPLNRLKSTKLYQRFTQSAVGKLFAK